MAEAAGAARKAIATEPELVEAHKTLGAILMETGDRAGAEAAFVAALREQPDEAECRSSLGKLLAERGDLAGAEKQFLAAAKYAPGTRVARFNLAVFLAEQKRFSEALPQAMEVVKLSPKDLEGLDLVGNLQMAGRDFRAAAATYRTALAVNPSYGRAQLGLGTALGAMNDFVGARKYLLEAANGVDAAVKAPGTRAGRGLKPIQRGNNRIYLECIARHTCRARIETWPNSRRSHSFWASPGTRAGRGLKHGD